MKAMRKILPALCMLLVSAVMLGSSTFAWFSSNQTVSASGMDITASAPTSLFISNVAGYAENTFKASATFKSTSTVASTVTPVDYQTKEKLGTGETAPIFFAVKDSSRVNGDGNVEGGLKDEDYNNTSGQLKNVFYEEFKLKLEGPEARKILVLPQLTAYGSDNNVITENIPEIYKAVHVVFYNGTTLVDFDMGTDNSAQMLMAKLESGATSEEWRVFVFVKGGDTDCKNANAKVSTKFSVSLTFSMEAAV